MGEERNNTTFRVKDVVSRDSGGYADEKTDKAHIMEIDNIHGHPVQVQWPLDPVREKKLMRKVDFMLVPWLFLLFLLAFLDRVNSIFTIASQFANGQLEMPVFRVSRPISECTAISTTLRF